MGVKTLLLPFLAFAYQLYQANAAMSEDCTYFGWDFVESNKNQLPFKTHNKVQTQKDCKDKCGPECIIWQYNKRKKICYTMSLIKSSRDENSFYGINHCKNGKPDNAPWCEVTTGNRMDYFLKQNDVEDFTECKSYCTNDCLLWHHHNEKGCRILKLRIGRGKASVGINYCTPTMCGIPNSNKKPTGINSGTQTCANTNTKIQGGEITDAHQYPWQVSIWKNKKGNAHWCGGTLISDQTILTAAHCVDDITKEEDFKLVTIKIGIHDATDNNHPALSISNIVMHPDYFGPPEDANDIAILTLSEPVIFDQKKIAPVCLPPPSDDVFDGTYLFRGAKFEEKECILLGFKEDDSTAGVLRHVQLKTWKNEDCGQEYGEKHMKDSFFPFSDQMCAIASKSHSHKGDSGGPLIIEIQNQFQQIGVLSHSLIHNDDAYNVVKTKDQAVVFTRVTSHLPFIKKHMKGDTWPLNDEQ